ncbi:MAG: MFS transporter [Terrimicrobiaceae bacterium]|nr:MFS transporter [Terrimicrobiaceae bacterium]
MGSRSPLYPPGAFNAHWFGFFNAISFQVMMGAPIILYAKSLGASSTVLGIIAAFTPLMTVFQLPAARFLDRFGYRQFVMMGWGTRVFFIFLVAVVPLLGFLGAVSKLAVLLAALFFFNLLRGISSAAWLPWITALIPEQVRGRFLSLDQIFTHAGCLLALGVSAILLAGEVEAWEYALVFLVSAVGGTLSLAFIQRIPEIEPGETTRRSSARVPWLAMLRHPPFRRLLEFNLFYLTVLGSLGVFTVEYLRGTEGLTPSTVLWLSGFSFAGALAALPFCGSLADRSGSRPLIRAAVAVFGIVIGAWFLMAGGAVPAAFWMIAVVNALAGVASAFFNVANARAVMSSMPEMGRNHFAALFSVITSLGLGAAPVMWGLVLDVLGTYEAVTGAFIWRKHSIYFLVLLVLDVAALALAGRIVEAKSGGSTEADPAYAQVKRLSRNWQRG